MLKHMRATTTYSARIFYQPRNLGGDAICSGPLVPARCSCRRYCCQHASEPIDSLWLASEVSPKGLGGFEIYENSWGPSKLSQPQILHLIKMLYRPAREFGFVSDLWTGPRVRVLIRKKFGIELHQKHMPRFLYRLGLVRKTPERRALEQDPKQVRRWLKRVLPDIVRSAARCRGLILYGDESLFGLIPHVGKTWTFPEVKPIVRVSGKRGVHVGVTSAVSAQGHLLFQFSKSNFNAATLIRFMDALHKHFGRRKLFFIIDGAPSHKARAVKQYEQRNASWLSLCLLPSYSPELNVDEKVWNFVKTNRLNAMPTGDKGQLRSIVLSALRSLQKRPKLVKSFFKY